MPIRDTLKSAKAAFARKPENFVSEDSLLNACLGLIETAKAADTFCEQDVFPAAERAGVKFVRLTRIQAFLDLEEAATAAAKAERKTGTADTDSLATIATTAMRLEKIVRDKDRGTLFTAAVANYVSLGRNYRGPVVSESLSGLVAEARAFETRKSAQAAADSNPLADIMDIFSQFADRANSARGNAQKNARPGPKGRQP